MEAVLICLLVFCVWKTYEMIYYHSKKFIRLKQRIQKYVVDCNELNMHIQNLKNVHIGANQLDYGKSSYTDMSKWNYKRPMLKKAKHSYNIYNCSRTVCDNSRKQPFKYICKYFNIEKNEESLSKVEEYTNRYQYDAFGAIREQQEGFTNGLWCHKLLLPKDGERQLRQLK